MSIDEHFRWAQDLACKYPVTIDTTWFLIRAAGEHFGHELAAAMAEVAIVRGLERNIDPFFVLFSVYQATR